MYCIFHLLYHRYFKALSVGEVAPVKDRLDNNPPANINDLTKGQLAMLHKQVDGIFIITKSK